MNVDSGKSGLSPDNSGKAPNWKVAPLRTSTDVAFKLPSATDPVRPDKIVVPAWISNVPVKVLVAPVMAKVPVPVLVMVVVAAPSVVPFHWKLSVPETFTVAPPVPTMMLRLRT